MVKNITTKKGYMFSILKTTAYENFKNIVLIKQHYKKIKSTATVLG